MSETEANTFALNLNTMFLIITLIVGYVGYKVFFSKNKIGNIKSKKLKLKQTGNKDNEVKDIDSNDTDIIQE